MKHLAVIMDGNGRWAVNQGQNRSYGYRFGAEAFSRLVGDFVTLPLSVITVYAFSTENNKRDQEEVSNIYTVIASFLLKEIFPICDKYGISVRFIGNKNGLPDHLKRIAVSKVANGDKTLVIALNYGGFDEIKRMTQKIIDSGIEFVGDQDIIDRLDTSGLPPVDAVLRYGGHKRLSNFLPLQTSYAELFFIDKFFPDYKKEDIINLIKEFETINRTFGGNNA